MISKNEGNLQTGWFYDEEEKILWIRIDAKNTRSNEWKISF